MALHFREKVTKLVNSRAERGVLIEFLGNLEYRFGPKIRHEFDVTIEKNRKGGVILDLRTVHRMDSSILGLLLFFNDELKKQEVPLILVPSAEVRDALYYTKLKSFFVLSDTVDEAKASLELSVFAP